MERVARIELANKPWQGFRLPLHHTRIIGVPPGTRTPTNSFGDCHAAITLEIQIVARWTGLEPATLGVTGQYSDQLSYHRVFLLIKSFGSQNKNRTCNDRLSADCYTI